MPVRFFLSLRHCLGFFFVVFAAARCALLTPVLIAQSQPAPPRVAQAQRFLAHRRLHPSAAPARVSLPLAQPQYTAGSAVWQPLGPASVSSIHFGAISGRVSAIAVDPNDPGGNTLYVGTTGGGLWYSGNAGANPSLIRFQSLTDSIDFSSALTPAISIGAVAVQPGNPNILLAGTGDPNDALDSYYGAGILRSEDRGNTWTLIQQSSDFEQGTGLYDFGFYGLGFAGFAWSDVPDPNTGTAPVVAAVSEAYEGTLVGAQWPTSRSAGLYYSQDNGATWHLATITDLNGQIVQGPLQLPAVSEGNPATAVVWNSAKHVFLAAIRFHGYYSSSDGGVTWSQLPNQPGTGFTAKNCPTNSGLQGSHACPILRGSLAVNPVTGDTYAWSVDITNQDQGIWQDVCAKDAKGNCTNASVTFGVQVGTSQAQPNQPGNVGATVTPGDYTLALSAVPTPSGDETVLLAGDDDLWQCISPPPGAGITQVACNWRNVTNSRTCLASGVPPYQHILTWNQGNALDPGNPEEIFLGNDSGLWRTTDGFGEDDTGVFCNTDPNTGDASHFQNLNASPGLGSLAEVDSVATSPATPYTMMLGLGVNGTVGIMGAKAPAVNAPWNQILTGQGGPVAIDPAAPNHWYVNNGAGVSIHGCFQSPCEQSDFNFIFGDSDLLNYDSWDMTQPAPFLLDPADSSQIIIATCRLWRGTKTSGESWDDTNAITSLLGSGSDPTRCSGNPQIRTLAAAPNGQGGEVIYVGAYGQAEDGAGNKPGHILKVTMDKSGKWTDWTDPGADLTFNPVVNDANYSTLNPYGLSVSSIVVDPSDPTGNTVYVTLQGLPSQSQPIDTVFRSTDGGATWSSLNSNLPYAPPNALAIDPLDPGTVYLATDIGVYATRCMLASPNCSLTCADKGSNCWAPMGSGLPMAPVTALSATPAGGSPATLVAGTYGRGAWQIPLFTSGELLTTAAISPNQLTFPNQQADSVGNPLQLTITNTGGVGLNITSVAVSGNNAADFSETDTCAGQEIVAGSNCTIQVLFAPTATGARSAQITVAGNITGGSLTAALSGTGTPPAAVTISPAVLSFPSTPVHSTSDPLSLSIGNSDKTTAVTVSSVTLTGPFQWSNKAYLDAMTLAPDSSGSVTVEFAPTQPGPATGTLTLVDDEGTHVVRLTGTGSAPPTDDLSPASLSFPDTIVGQPSAPLTVTLSNSGQGALTNIALSTTGPFSQANNCSTQLAAGSSCAISVVFTPDKVAAETGTLVLTDILSATAKTVALNGTGLAAPQFTVSPASIDFGNVEVGSQSAAHTVTVTNSGGTSLDNPGFNLSGKGAASFVLGKPTCPATLKPGASCSIAVTFKPLVATGVTADLAVSSSTRGVASAAVILYANGGTPGSGLQLQPSSVNFTPVGINTTGPSTTITLTNINPVQPLDDLAFKVSPGFTITGQTCVAGGSLAAAGACTISVASSPTATGAQSGTLTITSSGLGQPVTAALAGTGFDFTLAASGSSTVTVASGQTAIFQLKLATLGGVAESFAFQCATNPPASQANCVFTPATASLPANSSGTASALDVTTSTGTGTSSLASPPRHPAQPWLLACGLLLLPLAFRKRRRVLLLLAALAVSISAITSCAGAGGKGGSGGGGGIITNTTPSGTYTIPIWVTANGAPAVASGTPCDTSARQTGARHCMNLTMIVD